MACAAADTDTYYIVKTNSTGSTGKEFFEYIVRTDATTKEAALEVYHTTFPGDTSFTDVSSIQERQCDPVFFIRRTEENTAFIKYIQANVGEDFHSPYNWNASSSSPYNILCLNTFSDILEEFLHDTVSTEADTPGELCQWILSQYETENPDYIDGLESWLATKDVCVDDAGKVRETQLTASNEDHESLMDAIQTSWKTDPDVPVFILRIGMPHPHLIDWLLTWYEETHK